MQIKTVLSNPWDWLKCKYVNIPAGRAMRMWDTAGRSSDWRPGNSSAPPQDPALPPLWYTCTSAIPTHVPEETLFHVYQEVRLRIIRTILLLLAKHWIQPNYLWTGQFTHRQLYSSEHEWTVTNQHEQNSKTFWTKENIQPDSTVWKLKNKQN